MVFACIVIRRILFVLHIAGLGFRTYPVPAKEFKRKIDVDPGFKKEVDFWYEKVMESVTLGLLVVTGEIAVPKESSLLVRLLHTYCA